MSHTAAGFSLLETVVAMATIAILACIAIPSWSNAREAAHSSSAQAALLEGIMAAVSHAALTGRDVVLCPGDANGCRATSDWSRGWIAYADKDGDRIRDASETVLSTIAPLDGKVHLRSTRGRLRIVFQPNGGNAGSNATFTLCDGRGPDKAVTLVIANEGRLRSGQPTADAAAACMAAM